MSDAILVLHRQRNLLAERPELRHRLERERQILLLAPDEILHAASPATYLVRRGKMRVSEFLADGREITRAVLQGGTMLETAETGLPDPVADIYVLQDCVLMALGEAELWQLPVGALT